MMRVRYVMTPGGNLAAVIEGEPGLAGIGSVGLSGIGAPAGRKLRNFAKKLAKSKAFKALSRVAVMAADSASGGGASRALSVARNAARAARSLEHAVTRDLQRLPDALRPAAQAMVQQARELAHAPALERAASAIVQAAERQGPEGRRPEPAAPPAPPAQSEEVWAEDDDEDDYDDEGSE